MDVTAVVCEVFRLYEDLGQSQYLGEDVTKTQHSIQCAMAAEKDGASDQVSYTRSYNFYYMYPF